MDTEDVRLPTDVWVGALLRRVQAGGAFAMVLARGDAERGDVVVKLLRRDGAVRLLGRRYAGDGRRVFADLIAGGFAAAERDADAWLDKARARDPDLWIVEIADRDGRHFLTEPVEPAGDS